MSASSLEDRIARLQREIERLSAQHAERMAERRTSADPKMRELDAKRAEALARRVCQLGEMLKKLQRHRLGSPSTRKPATGAGVRD